MTDTDGQGKIITVATGVVGTASQFLSTSNCSLHVLDKLIVDISVEQAGLTYGAITDDYHFEGKFCRHFQSMIT